MLGRSKSSLRSIGLLWLRVALTEFYWDLAFAIDHLTRDSSFIVAALEDQSRVVSFEMPCEVDIAILALKVRQKDEKSAVPIFFER